MSTPAARISALCLTVIFSMTGIVSCAHTKQGLLTAIKENDTPLVSSIIEKRNGLVDSRYRTSNIKKITPLMLAAKYNNREMAEVLIRAGADINARDKHVIGSYSPLEYAAYYNSPAVAEFLIEKGADVNEKNDLGQTPLVQAVLMNSIDTAELLLKKGADPNSSDTQGNTPLIFAAARYHLHSMVRLLIRYGADVNAKNRKGRNALMTAAYHNIPDIMRTLIEAGAPVDAKDKKGMTALMISVSANYQRSDGAMVLIKYGAGVNLHDSKRRTALMHNIMMLHEKDFSFQNSRLLLRNRARVNHRDIHGWTVLNYAIDAPCDETFMERTVSMVDYILRNRAGVSHQDVFGKTPLHQLLTLPERMSPESRGQKHRDRILVLILNRRAPVNSRDNAGATPLILAAFWNDVSAMKILLRYGAKISERDNRGYNPLMCAASTDSLEAATLMLKRGSPVNAASDRGLTPLMVAAEHDAIGVARLFIRLGADLNASEKVFGRTALMKAVIYGSEEVFDLLIERGADLNSRDRGGRTALMLAINPHIWQENLITTILRSRIWQVRKSGTASLHMVRTLLRNGARMDFRDNRGFTVMDYTRLSKNRQVRKILREYTTRQE